MTLFRADSLHKGTAPRRQVNAQSASAAATCPTGYAVISGGLDTESIFTCAIQASAPWNTTKWFVDLRCDAGGPATDAVAKAVCITLA